MSAANDNARAHLPPKYISIRNARYAPPNEALRTNAKDTAWEREPRRRTPLQSNYITDATTEADQDASAKRRRICEGGVSGRTDEHGSPSCGSAEEDGRAFDLLRELGTRTKVVQLVASSGGLISRWNDAFARITKPSPSLRAMPLTIFELIEAQSLPSLFGMLALSLHHVGIVGGDVEDFPPAGGSGDRQEAPDRDDAPNDGVAARSADAAEDRQLSRPLSPSHLSITLPCKSFRKSSTRYDITVVFMNEMVSMKRCFLGILTPAAAERHDCDVDDGSLLTRSCDGSRDSLPASCGYVTAEPHAAEAPERDRNDRASAWRELPRGKILRVDDELLCRLLLGPTLQ